MLVQSTTPCASFAMATTSIACCKGHQIEDFKSACKEGACPLQKRLSLSL